MIKSYPVLFTAGLCLFFASDLLAQMHYQGHQGIQAAYGLRTPFADYYSIGYQRFFNQRLQVEVNGGYERGGYRRYSEIAQYNTLTQYDVENFFLHETLDYSFLRMFRRLYWNVGLGLTQTYQQANVRNISHSVDSLRLAEINEPLEFDASQAELSRQIRFGGHANLLLELYLSRYITVLARHRLIYMIRSNYEDWENQTLVGVRINF